MEFLYYALLRYTERSKEGNTQVPMFLYFPELLAFISCRRYIYMSKGPFDSMNIYCLYGFPKSGFTIIIGNRPLLTPENF